MIRILKYILCVVLITSVLSGCGTQRPGSQDTRDKSPAPETQKVNGSEQNTPKGTPDQNVMNGNGLESSDKTSTALPSKKPEAENEIPPASKNSEPAAEPQTSAAPGEGDADKPLAGRIICIDPGHQSTMKNRDVPVAPGAEAMMPDFAIGTKGISSGVFEYTVVLEVSKKLRDKLEGLGAKVIMTRETSDSTVSNVERAQIANDAGADIFVRIHCDGSDNSDAKGISVLYPGSKYISDKVMLEKSLDLSKSVLAGAVKETGAKDRGLFKRNDLIGFNYCKVPCTLIEMGFMTNPDEDILLNSDSYQGKLVDGMAAGIRDYFNN